MDTVHLIEVPYDSGWRDRRMGRGPAFLVGNGGREAVRGVAGNVEECRVESDDVFPTEIGTTFRLLGGIAARVRDADRSGHFPLVLAGNCSSTVGALAGLGPSRAGLLWFDAHGDFNTPETSGSGFLDGMGLAVAVGHCWQAVCAAIPGFAPLAEDRAALVGVRDLDPAEGERVRASQVASVNPGSIRDGGAADALEPVLDRWDGAVEGIYLHLDLDVCDPALAPVNPLQPAGGLSPDELRQCVAAAAGRHRILGASITAYDPASDPGGKGAAMAVALMEQLAEIAQRQ